MKAKIKRIYRITKYLWWQQRKAYTDMFDYNRENGYW